MKYNRTPFQQYAVDQHRKTNHFYDKIIPYEYHLEMVVKEVITHYKIGKDTQLTTEDLKKMPIGRLGLNVMTELNVLLDAAYGHDLIEDTRNTYNDVRGAGAGYEVAEIIYALTDDKGKNRKERGNANHYEQLIKVPGAAFVKFCDRIANAKYSKFTESSMFDKYKEENPTFMERCYIPELEVYQLRETLTNLFK